jgi:hypothetical protein
VVCLPIWQIKKQIWKFDLPGKRGWQIKTIIFPNMADRSVDCLLIWQIKKRILKFDLPRSSRTRPW